MKVTPELDRALTRLETVLKHLPGQHSQMSHGSGGGFDPAALPKDLRIKVDDEVRVKEGAKKYLGTDDLNLVAAAVGAPDGSTVKIKRNPSPYGQLVVKVTNGKLGFVSLRKIGQFEGKTIITNDVMTVKKAKQGKGTGTMSFARQVHFGGELGANRIATVAVKGANKNGYYTWARLGYEGNIRWTGEFPPKFGKAKKVSEMMKTEEGRKVWKDRGGEFHGKFDLKKGSQSRKVLDAYVKQKFE